MSVGRIQGQLHRTWGSCDDQLVSTAPASHQAFAPRQSLVLLLQASAPPPPAVQASARPRSSVAHMLRFMSLIPIHDVGTPFIDRSEACQLRVPKHAPTNLLIASYANGDRFLSLTSNSVLLFSRLRNSARRLEYATACPLSFPAYY